MGNEDRRARANASVFLVAYEALAKPLWGVLQERSQNTENRSQNNRTR
jgi:hypothetical protein